MDALEKLDRFIDELNSAQKRKASELEGDGNMSRKRKRRDLEEHNEAGMESEFATGGQAGKHMLHSVMCGGTVCTSYADAVIDKVSLDDLLKPLANSESSGVALEKAARVLASSKVDPLPAPLPTRAQERLDRQAAYETTKGEVEKWGPTMKHIREVSTTPFLAYIVLLK